MQVMKVIVFSFFLMVIVQLCQYCFKVLHAVVVVANTVLHLDYAGKKDLLAFRIGLSGLFSINKRSLFSHMEADRQT